MEQRSPANRLAAAQALWTSWEAEVLADGSTVAPLVIEQASQSEGHPWRYWRVTIDDQTAFNGARWSWDVACAWIASRQQDRALEGIAAFRKWRGRVWRDLVGRAIEGRTWRIAEAELRNALAGGDVDAKAIREGEAVVISPDEWPGLEWEKDENGEAIEFDNLQMMGERRYRRVTVSRADIMRVWTSLNSWAPEVADCVVEDAPASAVEPVDIEWTEIVEPRNVAMDKLTVPTERDDQSTPPADPMTALLDEIRRDIEEHIPRAAKPNPKRLEAMEYLLVQAADGGDPERRKRTTPPESAQIEASPFKRTTYREALRTLKDAQLFDRYYRRQTAADSDKKRL
jgi:hypothetical protein